MSISELHHISALNLRFYGFYEERLLDGFTSAGPKLESLNLNVPFLNCDPSKHLVPNTIHTFEPQTMCKSSTGMVLKMWVITVIRRGIDGKKLVHISVILSIYKRVQHGIFVAGSFRYICT
jgi:hypothetical protein